MEQTSFKSADNIPNFSHNNEALELSQISGISNAPSIVAGNEVKLINLMKINDE